MTNHEVINVNVALLQQRLRAVITDRSRYPQQMSVPTCLSRAADLAAGVIEELARKGSPSLVDPKPPGGGGYASRAPKTVAAGSAGSPRLTAADKKRDRLREALADGPLPYAEIRDRAGLTGGECKYLLRSTHGVAPTGDGRYALSSR